MRWRRKGDDFDTDEMQNEIKEGIETSQKPSHLFIQPNIPTGVAVNHFAYDIGLLNFGCIQ